MTHPNKWHTGRGLYLLTSYEYYRRVMPLGPRRSLS
jgi:hypothetical protein